MWEKTSREIVYIWSVNEYRPTPPFSMIANYTFNLIAQVIFWLNFDIYLVPRPLLIHRALWCLKP